MYYFWLIWKPDFDRYFRSTKISEFWIPRKLRFILSKYLGHICDDQTNGHLYRLVLQLAVDVHGEVVVAEFLLFVRHHLSWWCFFPSKWNESRIEAKNNFLLGHYVFFLIIFLNESFPASFKTNFLENKNCKFQRD